MKHIAVVLLLLFPVLFAMGQKASVEHSDVPIYLNTGLGMGVSRYYDGGVSPLVYSGVGLGANLGVSVEWFRFRASIDNRLDGCLGAGNKADTSAGANGGTFDMRMSFYYRFAEPLDGKMRLWVGADFNPYIDLRINRKMMNSAVGLTTMFGVNADFRLEFDIPSRHRTDLFTLYADISLPLMAVGDRPGYSYVYNATSSSNPIEYLIDGYESYSILMQGATTDIGIFFNLKNCNRVGLSYYWDYRTTRNAAPHRFDNAYHFLCLNLMFNIH